jgi:hypothetical protein
MIILNDSSKLLDGVQFVIGKKQKTKKKNNKGRSEVGRTNCYRRLEYQNLISLLKLSPLLCWLEVITKPMDPAIYERLFKI